eukprot:TRINITY_DN16330_c0_g1_i1.p1 TRINITY_DN16330_c0_g1~~TRINITY_DN16330_c0_g1_i1.p1  ORF type:complete len:168 (+),score=31.61 TRINITY_DN16330_c0_g1_i1:492-995(+)
MSSSVGLGVIDLVTQTEKVSASLGDGFLDVRRQHRETWKEFERQHIQIWEDKAAQIDTLRQQVKDLKLINSDLKAKAKSSQEDHNVLLSLSDGIRELEWSVGSSPNKKPKKKKKPSSLSRSHIPKRKTTSITQSAPSSNEPCYISSETSLTQKKKQTTIKIKIKTFK